MTWNGRHCIECTIHEDPRPWCECDPGEECVGPCRQRSHPPAYCPTTCALDPPTFGRRNQITCYSHNIDAGGHCSACGYNSDADPNRLADVEIPDLVNSPPHYTAYPVEVIELTEHLNFCRGNAVKYLARAGLKGGPEDEIKDIEKARWYCDREIARLKAKS